MRTCGDEICEFRFEEINLGSVFQEVKSDPSTAHFQLETAFMAFESKRATDLTEPFPGFLLQNREMRPKQGNLEFIRQAQEQKIDVKNAKKADGNNKHINLGRLFIKVIYSVLQDIGYIDTEQDFRQHINLRAEIALSKAPDKQDLLSKASCKTVAECVPLCYKLLRYIFSTQRKNL